MKRLKDTQINTNAVKKIQQDIKLKSPHPEKVKIIAVTKNFSFTAIQAATKHKIYNIGENKVQETEKKIFKKQMHTKTWLHFIGVLQSNKINKAIKIYDIIQSVDSFKKAEQINHKANSKGKTQKIYLQVNIGKDPKKQGFYKEEVGSLAQRGSGGKVSKELSQRRRGGGGVQVHTM